MLYKIEHGGFPVSECSPHGLTTASRWAPLRMYPQFPIRPRWCKETPAFPTTLVSSTGQQGGDEIKQKKKQLKDKKMRRSSLEGEIQKIQKNQDMQKRDGNIIDTTELNKKIAER